MRLLFTDRYKICDETLPSNQLSISTLPLPEAAPLCTRSMPQSKKDLRTAKQKQNVAKGIGDKDGKIPSNIKVTNYYRGGSKHDELIGLGENKINYQTQCSQGRAVTKLKSLQNSGAFRELFWVLLTKTEKVCYF